MLRSSTAIGAISPPEFSAKLSIAYKECLETKYWFSLLKDTGYIEEKAYDSIYKDGHGSAEGNTRGGAEFN